MADYKKMYFLLCRAADEVIDPLERIPLAVPYAEKLRLALLDAEEIYIETELYPKQSEDPAIIRLTRVDSDDN